MEFLSNLWNTLCNDIPTTIITLFLSFIVYNLLNLYIQVYSLPPGPLPLPIFGNALLFRGKEHWNETIRNLKQKYGSIFTLWIGNCPLVLIPDVELIREAYRKNDFSGRKRTLLGSFVSNEKHQDVILADYGETWETLRRVFHAASIKYSTNDKLIHFVTDCVDSTVKLMIEKEGINKGIKSFEYISLIFLNLISCTAFGKKYSVYDPEFIKLSTTFNTFVNGVGFRKTMWEFSSFFRLIDRNEIQKYKHGINWFINLVQNKFIDHYKDYDESIERDFSDALISAKNKALRESKDGAHLLTDENLAMCIFDLFGAGYDTTQFTFRWLLLFLSYYPEIQEKLRQEIDTQIGDRIPIHEDKNQCHYVMAYIFEVMRLKNVPTIGTSHMAIVDSKIGKYMIPKGTGVLGYHGIILTDEKYWPDGQEFRPERFLENEKLVTNRSKAFMPFGVGRRICLGEKLAYVNLFLVLVRFLQLTSGYKIVLGQNKGLEADKNATGNIIPYEFEIILKPSLVDI